MILSYNTYSFTDKFHIVHKLKLSHTSLVEKNYLENNVYNINKQK